MVPRQCLVGNLVVRRQEFSVFLVCHLDSAPRPFSELCFKVISCCSNSLRILPTDNSLQKWRRAHTVCGSALLLGSECPEIWSYVSWLPLSPTVVLQHPAFGQKWLTSRFVLEWERLSSQCKSLHDIIEVMDMWWLEKVEESHEQVICKAVLGQTKEAEAECRSALEVCSCVLMDF